jgi:hypothetical protein
VNWKPSPDTDEEVRLWMKSKGWEVTERSTISSGRPTPGRDDRYGAVIRLQSAFRSRSFSTSQPSRFWSISIASMWRMRFAGAQMRGMRWSSRGLV